MTTITDTTADPVAEAMAVQAHQRSAYTAGLRALADLLDGHPEVPLPYQGSDYSPMSITFLSTANPKSEMLTASRAFPGPHGKDVRSGEYGDYFDLTGTLHGLHYKLTAYRDAVCERIVTGTREVTREVPDPEALKVVPTTIVTETVEDVEWKCAPLLAAAEVSS